MACDSPQLLLCNPRGKALESPCGLCLSCCREKEDAERQRRFYWLKRKRGSAHV